MWRAGCTPLLQKSGNTWKTIRRSPSCSANICTTWATPWEAWRATSAWERNSPCTRAASSGTIWIRLSGRRTPWAANPWATAATLRSARATTASAATALSPPTAGRSPACRKCATGTCQRSSGTPGTRPMHKLWQPSGLCPPPATPRTSSSPKATEPGA